jgi:hypothetical protein
MHAYELNLDYMSESLNPPGRGPEYFPVAIFNVEVKRLALLAIEQTVGGTRVDFRD